MRNTNISNTAHRSIRRSSGLSVLSPQSSVLLLFLLVVALSSAVLLADEPTTSFTPGPLAIHVTAVQGGAQYRAAGEMKWRALKGPLDLSEGTELRTGPKGVIQFTVGTDQVYRVDRLTVVKLLRANLGADGTIKTDVGMTYGRVSKDVDAPARPHEDVIVTPSSTLAVRGTRVSLYDQPPFEPEAISITGTAIANFNKLSHSVVFGAKGQGVAAVNANNPDAANNSLVGSYVDPTPPTALTGYENRFNQFNPSNRVQPISNPPSFPTVSDTGDPSYAELQTIAQNNALTFAVSWNTDTHVQMELIGSIAGGGEFVYPVLGFNKSRNGGTIPFDNLGGPGGGYEIITYPTVPPTGFYSIGATNVGTTDTTVTFSGFIKEDGKLIPQQFFVNPANPFVQTPTSVQSLPAGQTTLAVTSVPQSSIFTTGGTLPFARAHR
jgi:hypothetical protein